MGIFDSIKEKVFGKKAETPAPTEAPATTAAAPKISLSAMTQAAKAAVAPVIDVEAIVEEKVKAKGIKLNWRESIVDLLKALDLDSSLAARKELAADLKYDGPHADGSAEKNIWLHKAVMKALAENGGLVPEALLK